MRPDLVRPPRANVRGHFIPVLPVQFQSTHELAMFFLGPAAGLAVEIALALKRGRLVLGLGVFEKISSVVR